MQSCFLFLSAFMETGCRFRIMMEGEKRPFWGSINSLQPVVVQQHYIFWWPKFTTTSSISPNWLHWESAGDLSHSQDPSQRKGFNWSRVWLGIFFSPSKLKWHRGMRTSILKLSFLVHQDHTWGVKEWTFNSPPCSEKAHHSTHVTCKSIINSSVSK